jgi:hypothetical protein
VQIRMVVGKAFIVKGDGLFVESYKLWSKCGHSCVLEYDSGM